MSESTLHSLLEQRSLFLRFVQRRVQDPALAEDIVQAAYIRALQLETDVPQDSVVSWFYRVLRNAVIDQYRRHQTEHKALAAWGTEMEHQTAPSLEDQHEVCACLSRVMDSLRPEYADLLRAVELNETPLLLYAQQHQLTPGNAGVRAHRARTALRKQLIKACGTCAEASCMDCTCKREHV